MTGPSVRNAHKGRFSFVRYTAFMQPPYTKPHLSIPDQLALLQARGMTIGDPERAARYLARLGYYRLSGYWYPARIRHTTLDAGGRARSIATDQFRPGTTFERTVDLYIFDKQLRLLFLDAIERIEVSVRVEAALLLSAINPFAHRNPALLAGTFAKQRDPQTGRTAHAAWLARLDDASRRSREEFVRRYQDKYASPLPIWIAIELWDFGMLSHFVAGMTHADTTALARRYQIPRGDLLISWLRTLNELRNACAHHNRLWNRVFIAVPKSPAAGDLPLVAPAIADKTSRNRLYAAAAISAHLMTIIAPRSAWRTRLLDLMATFPAGPGIVRASSGFPERVRDLPLWQA